MLLHLELFLPPVTLTPDHDQSEQAPLPHRIYTLVADEATDPVTPDTVRSVMGTPVVGVPVGLPFS